MKPETVDLRDRVYRLMGGACVDCGETDFNLLTIDHVHNDGGLERRITQRFGATKYRHYLRHGIPRTGVYAIELRCWNCNQGKKLRYEQAQHQVVDKGTHIMPSKAATKQINPSVSTHTIDALEKRQLAWHCTQGQAIDRLMIFYEEFDGWKAEVHLLLMGLQTSLQQAFPKSDHVDDDHDPYEVLAHADSNRRQSTPLRVIGPPRRSLLMRIFGARA